MIPVADAIYILVPCMVATLTLGWAGRWAFERDRLERASDAADQAAGAARLYEAYEADREQRAAEAEHDAAWEAEFSAPDLGDFVTGVLDQAPARSPFECSDPPAESCSDAGCPIHGDDWDDTPEYDDRPPLDFAPCPSCGGGPSDLHGECGIQGAVVVRQEPAGLAVPAVAFPPEPWCTLDNPATGERLPTVGEVADSAGYWLWRTEMEGLIEGARDWYDREFGTGQFRAVGR